MQTPYRRKETYVKPKPDPYLTEAKFLELKNKLERMKASHPALASEVKRLAEMGDFSENAGYQDAKHKLRGLNQRILELEAHLKVAVIFHPSNDIESVKLGHKVTIETDGKEKTYTILGGSETNPTGGIISHNSPIGAALLNHKVGDIIKVIINDKEKIYKILNIS